MHVFQPQLQALYYAIRVSLVIRVLSLKGVHRHITRGISVLTICVPALACYPSFAGDVFIGIWQLESSVENGILLDTTTLIKHQSWTWEFKEDGWRVRAHNGEEVLAYEGKTIKSQGIWQFEGVYIGSNEEYKKHFGGMKVRGIIRVDGDTLERCYWLRDGYPDQFVSTAGSKATYQRFKKKKH